MGHYWSEMMSADDEAEALARDRRLHNLRQQGITRLMSADASRLFACGGCGCTLADPETHLKVCPGHQPVPVVA